MWIFYRQQCCSAGAIINKMWACWIPWICYRMGNDGVSKWACKFLSLVHVFELTGLSLPNDQITCLTIAMLSCSKIKRNVPPFKLVLWTDLNFETSYTKEGSAISDVLGPLAAWPVPRHHKARHSQSPQEPDLAGWSPGQRPGDVS